MKHPSEEKSMDYLYGEIPSIERKEIEQHLQSCSVCREQFRRLRDTHAMLGQWRIEMPAKHRFVPQWSSGLKWGAAALVLMTTAFATGRFSSPRINTEALEAKLAKPLQETIERQLEVKMRTDAEKSLQDARQKLHDELAATFQQLAEQASAAAFARNQAELDKLSLTFAALRDEDKKTVYAALKELQAQHLTDFRKLRSELETVAYTADETLRSTQQQLVQLAYDTSEK